MVMKVVLLLSVVIGTALARSHKKLESEAEDEVHWTVYEREYFHHEELCDVLNCGKHDVCLVKKNNAMCFSMARLFEIKGHKKFFRPSDAENDKQSHNSKSESLTDQEWKDKYQAKLDRFEAKLDLNDAEREKHTNDYVKPYKKGKHNSKHSNHKDHDLKERHSTPAPLQDCSASELKDMGGRLLQWFTDVHNVEKTSVSAPLPKHHIRCRDNVGWMFQQMDGDKDGELTVDELYSLEHDQYEPCIRPFLDRCDVDADSTISLDEWCDCFEWSDNAKKEPPCHKELRKADPHLLGGFRPRCNLEGFYRPEQCHEGTCWCADNWGREFDHSRTHGRADCGQYAETNSDDEDLVDGSGQLRQDL